MIKKIVLIGFRGTGKTTVGKQLSQKLNWPCISSDAVIEKKINMPISQFVKENGWQQFRKIETLVLKEISKVGQSIIDCGGGIIEKAENINYLNKDALIVWVDAALEDIFHRLRQNNDRPLLNKDDLYEDTKTNYLRRENLYRQYSNLYVNTSADNLDIIIKKISDSLTHPLF